MISFKKNNNNTILLIHQKGILLWESARVHICEYVCLWLCVYVYVRYPGYFRTCACLYPCAHPALVIRLASRIPDIAASRLIRAGIQPPWLHLTISHRATYSIISCLNWRALLSLTQADRKFPFISCKKKERKEKQQASPRLSRPHTRIQRRYDYKLKVWSWDTGELQTRSKQKIWLFFFVCVKVKKTKLWELVFARPKACVSLLHVCIFHTGDYKFWVCACALVWVCVLAVVHFVTLAFNFLWFSLH